MSEMVLGTFSNKNNAERALYDLNTLGYNPKDIAIVIKNNPDEDSKHLSTGQNVIQGFISGALMGSVLGGMAGLLLGMGAIVLPGLRSLFIGDTFSNMLGLSGGVATTVSGAVTGLLAGGFAGALIGLGVQNEAAEYSEENTRDSGVLVAVPVASRKQREVKQVFQAYEADQIKAISSKDYFEKEIKEQSAYPYRPSGVVSYGSPAFYSEVRRIKRKRDKKLAGNR